jgi:hypothetical protein
MLLANGKTPRPGTFEWAVTSPRWGNKKVKSIRFKDPFTS